MTLSNEAALRKDRTNAYSQLEHRHFATIAAILAELPARPKNKTEIIELFANRLSGTNPRFDRSRFLTACGG